MDLPIENKPIKYNTITILDDDVNIYCVYNTLKQQIYSISKLIEQKEKRLGELIKGQKDVQAQQYDKVVKSSGNVENILEFFKELVALVAEIKQLKNQLNEKKRNKGEIESIVRECLELNPRNLELRVFYHRHIKNESLKKIHKRLRRFNAYGEKVRYNYSYIRYINTKIIEKMGKPNNSGLKSNTSL